MLIFGYLYFIAQICPSKDYGTSAVENKFPYVLFSLYKLLENLLVLLDEEPLVNHTNSPIES